MNQISKICVFCGSSSGNNGHYRKSAVELGNKMAEENMGLVYGGSNIGLMGTVANTLLQKKGKVIGVIPEVLKRPEVAHNQLSELHVVETMHERKAMMAELSDAFLILPGGFGTLDETFEAITWAQLGIHSKPIGFLNIDGYFDPLYEFIKHAYANGFIRKQNLDLFFMASGINECFEKLHSFNGKAIPLNHLTHDKI
ncbi:MAG TPA: TIGR00730 family Rossman fold protein [Balneolales bacterium]|nr:TIGR00730 family Rossman fold protein [Balneolales bacterium]